MRKYDNFLDIELMFAKSFQTGGEVVGVSLKKRRKSGFDIVDATIGEDNQLGRRAGEYSTVNFKELGGLNIKKLTKILSEIVRRYVLGAKRVLIVGMGNRFIISDALGPITIEKISTQKIAEDSEIVVAKISPGVESYSGIESFEYVKAIVESFKPDKVIVVDSLCSTDHTRLGLSIQFSNAGIVPGSASGKTSCNLTKTGLGVEVIAIGVPLVVYLGSVVQNVIKNIKPLSHGDLKVLKDLTSDSIYSPKEIDFLIEVCSGIIASAIENALI